MKMIRTHLHLTTQQLAQLQSLSAQGGLSIAELVRRAVDDFLTHRAAGLTKPADTGSVGDATNNHGAITR
jgi:hypothetical protein